MFYTFHQNNSGGRFVNDDTVSHFVIIEADSPNEANHKAVSLGIYFDGVGDGSDCGCCGDRWYTASEYDGKESPMIYGKPPSAHRDNRSIQLFCDKGETYCIVYYTDGRIVRFTNGRKAKAKRSKKNKKVNKARRTKEKSNAD